MKSFRIHTCHPSDLGPIPYMLIEFLGMGKVSLNFDSLHSDKSPAIPQITLTAQALYDVLQGKPLAVAGMDGETVFIPEGNELLIVREAHGNRPKSQYRVWSSEVSVAWNMLGWI